MNKKISLGNLIIIGIFLCVIFMPLYVGWGTDFMWEDTENRSMADKPTFELESIDTYCEKMNAYFSDNVPFRKAWLRCNGAIRYGIFKSSNNALSLPGKDGWIFYGDSGGENSVADYMQTNLFSQEQLKDLCASLQGFKNYLDSQGIEFRLMINLNKSHIYLEYMPDSINAGTGITRAEQLIEYLECNSDIEVVYPKNALIEAKEDYLLYCPTDAHWNTIGGYIGFMELQKSINPEFEALPISEISPQYSTSNWGDVANIINAAWFTNNIWTTSSYKEECILEWKYRTDEDPITYVRNSHGNGLKLLTYNDSYMNQMQEYLAKEYSLCEFVEKDFTIEESEILSINPDIVVFEILERMLNQYSEELRYWQKYY